MLSIDKKIKGGVLLCSHTVKFGDQGLTLFSRALHPIQGQTEPCSMNIMDFWQDLKFCYLDTARR